MEALTLYNAQAVLYELPTRLAWELRLGSTEHSWQDPQDIALALRDTRAGIVVAQVRLSPEQDGRRVIAYTFKPGPTIEQAHLTFRPGQPNPSRSEWRPIIHDWLLERMANRLRKLMAEGRLETG